MNNNLKELIEDIKYGIKNGTDREGIKIDGIGLSWNNLKLLINEIERLNNIINAIKEELSKDFYTYVCKNRTYGKTFKAGAEVYKEHLLYKIKELENDIK